MAIGEPLVWISVISGRLSRLKAVAKARVAKARGVMTSEHGGTGVVRRWSCYGSNHRRGEASTRRDNNTLCSQR
jgi:hypothetical protein